MSDERNEPRLQSLLPLNWKQSLLMLLGILFMPFTVHYPRGSWLFGTGMVTVSFVSIFLRCGWVIPCTLAGVFLGLINDATIKRGSIESQMWETPTSISVATFVGLGMGLLLDEIARRRDTPRK